MNHLILKVKDGWVTYQMGGKTGMHPIGDDYPSQVIDYLVRIINPSSHEIHYYPTEQTNE